MTRGLPDKLRLVEHMIAEATCAIVAIRWREVSLRPGSEPHQRTHQLRIELERHLAALRLSRIVLQVERDKLGRQL